MSQEATTEKRVVAACLKSREAFGRIKKHLDTKQFSPYGEWCVQQIEQFFDKDAKAEVVDPVHLVELADLKFDNPSKANLYKGYIEACAAVDISPINLADLILESKRKAVGNELAASLANDASSKKTNDLLEKFEDLKIVVEEEPEEILNNVSVEQITKEVTSATGRIKLAPRSLNERIKNGALPGHHIVVFARPETGKTALVLSIMRAFCLQQLDGAYFGNEDPILDVIGRFQSCLTGMTEDERTADPAKAAGLLEKNGYKRATFIPIHPGSLSEINKHVTRLKPKWIIVDQIRNLNVGAESRVNQLEAAAQGIRNIGKKHGVVTVSVTQAGDSADNKLVLGMGDIDFSNTGIPATADLMIGMGVNNEYYEQGIRVLSLCKNKLGGNHENFQVRLTKALSRVETI